MLHHRGRADRQFKVHGNRIEPAEIEAVLLAAPQIDNAFVKPVACGDDLQIVAYVESTGASEESLRAHCTRLLPLHMVPAEFHSYEQFPRLPNGKVDLQQMSRTVRPRAPASGSAVKVGEALSLRELWQSFLPGCEVTGKTDFFAAGGDSLLAMRIMNRVGELSGVKAPMTLLFQHPVLEAFETALQSLRPEHKNMRSMDDERYIKAGGSAASVASDYAQTNVQLYEQLFGQGYTPVQLKQLAAAYDLALGLFSTLLRPEGKPFVNHLVGTASILAQHGTAFPVVVGGLLHAAYSYGEFGSFRCGVTPRKRIQVRAVIGKEAEEIVYRYTQFQWNARVIDSLGKQLPKLSQDERIVIFMRLANELEEGADARLLYCAEETRLLKANYLGMCVDVAKAIGMHDLAAELECCSLNNSVNNVSDRPEIGRRDVYSLPVLTRLKQAICHAVRQLYT